MALTRIAQEHADLQRDPLKTCFAGPAEAGNPRRWVGHITGPPDTPYEQRDFSIAIVFPQDYPLKPFQLTFTTPLSHPNISEEGKVRLAELEEKHWSPVLTVRSILICLQALLANPDPSKGVSNSEAARVYLTKNPQEHNVSSSAADGYEQPTHHGRRIGGKKYGIDMSRPEFEEYKNLTRVEEKNKFFIENADIVRDITLSPASLNFPECVREIFGSTPSSDRMIHSAVDGVAKAHLVEISKKATFKGLIYSACARDEPVRVTSHPTK